MTQTLERADFARPVDPAGRHILRGNLDSRSITKKEDGSIGFIGSAIVFNERTWIGSRSWGYWEQVAPEAVTKTLQEADVRFLINHDPNLLLARNTAGTLRLTADETKLAVDADMAPTTYAQDLAVLLGRGDISQMSFAFEELGYAYSELANGEPLYTITELRLFDVSVVTYPAYDVTDAGLRAVAFEQLLRARGLSDIESRKVARTLASGQDLDQELALRAGFVPAASDAAPPEHAEPDGPLDAPAKPTDEIRSLRLATLAARTNELERGTHAFPHHTD